MPSHQFFLLLLSTQTSARRAGVLPCSGVATLYFYTVGLCLCSSWPPAISNSPPSLTRTSPLPLLLCLTSSRNFPFIYIHHHHHHPPTALISPQLSFQKCYKAPIPIVAAFCCCCSCVASFAKLFGADSLTSTKPHPKQKKTKRRRKKKETSPSSP